MTSFLKGTAQAFIAMWLISGIFNVVLLSNHKHYTKAFNRPAEPSIRFNSEYAKVFAYGPIATAEQFVDYAIWIK